MLELGALIGASSVAMGIDVDHADRFLLSHRLHDRRGDRVVTANAERTDACRDEALVESLDILMA